MSAAQNGNDRGKLGPLVKQLLGSRESATTPRRGLGRSRKPLDAVVDCYTTRVGVLASVAAFASVTGNTSLGWFAVVAFQGDMLIMFSLYLLERSTPHTRRAPRPRRVERRKKPPQS